MLSGQALLATLFGGRVAQQVVDGTPQGATRIRDLALTHIALVASFAIVALSVLRVLYFANMSIPVALAVLSTSDRTTVVTSTLVSAAAILGPLALLLRGPRRWLLAGNDENAPFGTKLRTAFLWLPLAYLLPSVVSPLMFAAVVLGPAIAWAVVRRWKSRDKNEPKEAVDSRNRGRADWILWTGATLIASVALTVIGRPWQPIEAVTVADSDTPVVGYVIGEQANQVLVISRNRLPVWIPTNSIEHREVCEEQAGSWLLRPLRELWMPSDLPECPAMSARPQSASGLSDPPSGAGGVPQLTTIPRLDLTGNSARRTSTSPPV